MKKLIVIPLLVMVLLLGGCGNEQQVQTYTWPEMDNVYIEADPLPGDEYVWGWCTVDEERSAVEIKLRGNSSKEAEKKAYNIKFEEDTDFLGMDPGRKWALVSNPFDKSLLRPFIGFTYAQELGIMYTPDVRLCKVWLNGEYRGVYTAVEPVEAGAGRVEIDPDNGDFLLERNVGRSEEDKFYIESPAGMRFEFNEPEEPTDEQLEECGRLLAAAEEAIYTSDHKIYETVIDVDSFVNFYIFQEMIKDVDFGEFSTRYYFKDGILYAGPPWDLDLTMGNVSSEKPEYKYSAYNNTDGAGDESGDSANGLWVNGSDYYYWLCKDPWFREMVWQRWKAVRDITENLAGAKGNSVSMLDSIMSNYGSDLESNFTEADWSVSEPYHVSEWQEPAQTYEENVEMLRTWLNKRVKYLDHALKGQH